MGVITCIFLIITIIIAFRIYKEKWCSPILLFSILWLLIVGGSLFQCYGMYATSPQTYFIVFLGVAGFVLGCRTSTNIPHRRIYRYVRPQTIEIRYDAAIALSLITIYYLIKRAIIVTGLFATGMSMADIRMNYSEYVIQNGFDGLIDNYIAHPFIFAILPIAIFSTITKPDSSKKSVILLILTFIIILLYSYCDGGRIIFAYIFFHLLLSYTLSKQKIRFTFAQKITWAVIFLLAIIIVIAISNARESTFTFGQTIYTYLCGCMPHLDYRLTSYDEQVYLFSGAFFKGIMEFPLFFAKNIGLLHEYPEWFIKTQETLDVSDFINIGSQNFNAFVSPFYYFYADFRHIGVFFGSAIYGFLSDRLYRQSIISNNLRYTIAYMVIAQTIFMSMVRWQFYNVVFVFSFLYIILFIKPKKSLYGNWGITIFITNTYS